MKLVMLMDREFRNIKNIIKQCKKNNRQAQKELYKLFYAYCMSICLRYAKSREDAVEIMNDGFINLFTYIQVFDVNKPLKPWLRKIMINAAIDHNKKYNKMQMTTIENNTENVTNKINDSVSYNDLIEIIRKLPNAYQMVFNLKAIEGYKHEEIAKMLGISDGTSKSNYAKAKQKLQTYLAVYFDVNQ